MKLEELNAWFEQTFDCVDGPPRSYFRVGGARYEYQTILLGGTGTEEELVALVHDYFVKLIGHKRDEPLWWRSRPSVANESTVDNPLVKVVFSCRLYMDGLKDLMAVRGEKITQ
jgi:hypothetical protein